MLSSQDEQAIERIVSGQEGGPFADFGPLIGEYVGMQRAKMSLSGDDSPSGSVGGVGDFSTEFATGPDGGPTTVSNAMSESLLIGRDFGIGTDIETGPNGNLYVVSLSNGAVYEIFRR